MEVGRLKRKSPDVHLQLRGAIEVITAHVHCSNFTKLYNSI